jgi:membrane-bound serine protease (ClpP class)
MKHLTFLAFFIFLLSAASIFSQTIYVANIEGEIDLGMAPYIKRVVHDAEKNSAKAIVFRINTFGGRVDAATQIKDAILNSKVKTIAFVDKRAISAGSLIALSCEKIVMVPGALMGATTVVDQEGKKQSEKYQSYMRSEMRATAEKNRRRTDIAQAMVDETVVIPDLMDDSTKLVTLTTEEAVKYKMADTTLSSVEELKIAYGLTGFDEIGIRSNWAEETVSFLNNPVVSSLLILVGLIGIFMEIKMGVWGVPGTVAVIALALFFGSGYILELASVTEIMLFVLGVILLLIEIFIIPGFGIVGILGIILMISGLFLGMLPSSFMNDSNFVSLAIIQLASTFIASAIVIYILSKVLPKTKVFNRLILNDALSSKSGSVVKPSLENLTGTGGKAITDLRPSGLALINGNRVDVVTEGDYINHDSDIVVKKVEGSKVVVTKK